MAHLISVFLVYLFNKMDLAFLRSAELHGNCPKPTGESG
jgi:hypothetical protein